MSRGRARGTAIAAVVATFVLIVAGLRVFAPEPNWTSLREQLARAYPDVCREPPLVIAKRLSGERGIVPALLDVRSEAEFAVSHLRGAIRIDPGAPPPAGLPAGPIVTYCAVGSRSSALARRLGATGREVVDIDGGIFAWAAAGLPMEDAAGARATTVHPYDAYWGRLLPQALRAQASGGQPSLPPP